MSITTRERKEKTRNILQFYQQALKRIEILSFSSRNGVLLLITNKILPCNQIMFQFSGKRHNFTEFILKLAHQKIQRIFTKKKTKRKLWLHSCSVFFIMIFANISILYFTIWQIILLFHVLAMHNSSSLLPEKNC